MSRDSRAEARKAWRLLRKMVLPLRIWPSSTPEILAILESLARREYEAGFKAGVIAVKEFPREWGVTVAQVQARHEARRRG